MKTIFLLFILLFILISCEPTQDFKGEIIPDNQYISDLLFSENRQNNKVISYLNQIMEDGSSPQLYYLRAKYLYESRQYKKANVDIQYALKSSPRDPDYAFVAGQIALDLENYENSSKYFNLIKSNRINNSSVLLLLAEASVKLKKYTLATFYLNQITLSDLSKKDQLYYPFLLHLSTDKPMTNQNLWNKLDPNNGQDVRMQRFYFDHALAHTSKYLYQNQLLKAIKQYPNDPHLLRFWARFLNQVNQYKKAELAYGKVANLFESNHLFYLEVGSFYMQHRNYSLALSFLDKIKPNLTSFIDVPFLKSKCYLYLGDKKNYQLMLDSVQVAFKNDSKFYQMKIKHFGISIDSALVVRDSLLMIRP